MQPLLQIVIAPVKAFPEQCAALRTLFEYSDDASPHGVLSNSPHSSIFLAANKCETVPGILDLLANEIAWPSPLSFWVGLFLLGWTFPFVTASAIALLVWRGVGGCLCPISSKMI